MTGSPPAAEPPEPQAQRSEVGLATITLRQIRVSRADVQDKPSSADANPMNRLVPYLDLFGRLSDEELARLAGVPASVANNLRLQVVQVDRALTRFTDLLPRLTDAELVRLTGATAKTIRFWRLCQPRYPMSGAEAQGWSVAQAADALGRVQSSTEVARRTGGTGTWHAAMSDEPPLDSGAPLEPRHAAVEPARHAVRHPTGETSGAYRLSAGDREATAPPRVSAGDGSSAYRMPTAERESGSSAYRMPIAEREAGSSAQRLPTGERESGSSAYRMPTAERESGSSAHRLPTGERESGSSAYRMPTAEREAGRRALDPPAHASASSSRMPIVPVAPVDLSRPRTGRTEELPAVKGATPPPPPPVRQPPPKQAAVAQQMKFSGAPFPGHDYEAERAPPVEDEDDGIFIGLELPDPRTLAHPGRRE